MRLIRATLVALIALSLAALPAVGAEMRDHSPHARLSSAKSDCCAQGEHCQNKAKGECGKFAACVLKCSTVFAATLATSGLAPVLSAPELSLAVSERPISRASNQPLPPPRV